MHFASPLFLLLLLGLVAAAAMIGAAFRWKRRAEEQFAAPDRFGRLTPDYSRRRQLLKAGLVLAALTLIALAAARPWWQAQEAKVRRQGVDLVIVLDVSLSMQAQDVKPSRFARAQDELSLLLDRLTGNRVGLVFFADAATVRAPLTSDTQAIKQLIARAPEDAAFLSPGSSIAEGIKSAESLLKERQTAGRVILVVSDGEDLKSGAVDAAREAQAAHIAVYTAGVGTAAGGTMPVRGPGGQQSVKLDPRTNQPAITRANDDLLRAVAQAGGGRFLSANASSPALTSLVDDLDKMELTTFAESGRQQPVEEFQWFAGAALILLVAEVVIAEHRRLPRPALGPARRRRLLFAPLGLLVLITGCTAAARVYTLNEEGNRAYRAGDFAAALDAYQRAQQDRPDLPELNYNAGNALHMLGNFDRAIAESRRATESDRVQVRDQAFYSLGNHYYRQGRLREAYEAYRSALIQDPNDDDARYNLELVLRRLNEPEQPQAQPGQQGDTGQTAQPSPDPGQQQGNPAPQQPGAAQPGAQNPSPPGGTDQDTRRSLEEALKGIDDNFSVEDAIRILDLLRRQQAEQAQQRGAQPGSRSSTPDW